MRRTLIVTGGSRGIGAGVVRAALRQGWRVCFSWSGNAEAAARLEADCADDAENLLAVRADAADARQTEALFEACAAAFGTPDALFTNAGVIGPIAPTSDLDAADIDHVLSVNVRGTLLACGAFARHAARAPAPGRAIVTMSSIAARTGGMRHAVTYAASKGAIVSLTMGLAKELAPDIRVNAVAPGLIETEMLEQLAGGASPMRALAGQVPLRRLGTCDDVARAVLWLLSGESSYTSGTVVDVAGGR